MAKYWFRQKSFGYGATPNTWQGWLFTLAGVLLVTSIVVFSHRIGDEETRALWIVLGVAVVLLPFCLIAYVKTEGGWRWRWGDDT